MSRVISPGAAYDRIRKYMSSRESALEDAIDKLKERHAIATKDRVDEIVGQCADPQALLVMLDATNKLGPMPTVLDVSVDPTEHAADSVNEAANAPYEESHEPTIAQPIEQVNTLTDPKTAWLNVPPPKTTPAIVVDRSNQKESR